MILLGMALAAPLVEWDLESDDGGFVAAGDAAAWSWGVVANGPGSGWDGGAAWSTGLTEDYLNDATDTLEVPLPDLGSAARPALTFVHWYAIAHGDYAAMEVNTGEGWAAISPNYGYPEPSGWTGDSGGWVRVGVDLSGLGAVLGFRFVFSADESGVADGWFIDNVGLYDGDVTPPRIYSASVLSDTTDVAGPYPVTVTVEDDVGVASVTLYVSVNGGAETPIPMEPGADSRWSAEIPGQEAGSTVEWHVVASDGVNSAALPAIGVESFRVYLPGPVDLVGPTGRVVSTTAALSWTAPESEHALEGYVVYRDGNAVLETTSTRADAPLAGENDVFTVRARFDVGESDPSNQVEVDAVLPRVTALDPAAGYPGESLRVALSGEYLLLAEGEVAVAIGEGVTVDAVDVRDVDVAWLDLTITATAEPGARDVVLASYVGEVVGTGAFTVLAASDRPRLQSVSPDHAAQGERAELVVGFVGAMAGIPTAELGEGIVVEAVEVSGDTVTLTVAIGGNAPLGGHALVLDDGVRRWEGVEIEVDDVLVESNRSCGLGVSPRWAALLVAGMLVRRAARR